MEYADANYGEGLDISGDGGERSYLYDGVDRIELVTFEDGSTIDYDYNDADNVVTVTETASATTGSPDPRVTEYAYWDDGLLKTVTIKRTGQSDRVFTYHYDSIGRMERIDYPEGGIQVFFDDGASNSGWDENGRLKHMRYEKNSSLLRSFEFDYDDSGNRTLQIDTTPSGSVRWEYEYDWLDRLTKVWKGTNGGTPLNVSIYTYDESDNRTKFELPQDVLEFVYDYDDAGQITSREKKNTGGASIFTETFAHDDDGNLTSRSRPDGAETLSVSYVWNDFNRLIAVSSTRDGNPSTDAKQENLYGVNGFRRKKKDKNDVETTEYAEGLATAVAKSTSDVTTYLQAHGLVGFEHNGSFYYFLTDALGSVRDIIGYNQSTSQWEVVQSYEFDENGNHLISPMMGGPDSAKTFVGGMSVNDDTGDSGLFMMGHRHYDPSLGRFLSRDPIGFDGGLNLYNYAGANPINFVDADGLEYMDPNTVNPFGFVYGANSQSQQATFAAGGIFLGTVGLLLSMGIPDWTDAGLFAALKGLHGIRKGARGLKIIGKFDPKPHELDIGEYFMKKGDDVVMVGAGRGISRNSDLMLNGKFWEAKSITKDCNDPYVAFTSHVNSAVRQHRKPLKLRPKDLRIIIDGRDKGLRIHDIERVASRYIKGQLHRKAEIQDFIFIGTNGHIRVPAWRLGR